MKKIIAKITRVYTQKTKKGTTLATYYLPASKTRKAGMAASFIPSILTKIREIKAWLQGRLTVIQGQKVWLDKPKDKKSVVEPRFCKAPKNIQKTQIKVLAGSILYSLAEAAQEVGEGLRAMTLHHKG